MPPAPSIARPPVAGIWRVGRGPDPLRLGEPRRYEEGDEKVGNRFDSFLGRYGVLYFASSLEGCFVETLSRFRPDPRLRDLLADEWAERGFMSVGSVPRDWRTRRVAVRAGLRTARSFLDVEDADTLAWLQQTAGPEMALLDVHELDVPTMRGPNRALTRMVSELAWMARDDAGEPRYAGIRYLSRLDSERECWLAVFDDVDLEELERQPLLASNPALARIADRYGLTVH